MVSEIQLLPCSSHDLQQVVHKKDEHTNKASLLIWWLRSTRLQFGMMLNCSVWFLGLGHVAELHGKSFLKRRAGSACSCLSAQQCTTHRRGHSESLQQPWLDVF